MSVRSVLHTLLEFALAQPRSRIKTHGQCESLGRHLEVVPITLMFKTSRRLFCCRIDAELDNFLVTSGLNAAP